MKLRDILLPRDNSVEVTQSNLFAEPGYIQLSWQWRQDAGSDPILIDSMLVDHGIVRTEKTAA